MNLIDWFYKGLTIEQYIDSMNVNKEKLLHIKQNYLLHATDEIHSLQELHLKAIVITADWCGDAMVNLPIFMTIVDAANIEVRCLIRDENLELMDQYLTNGTARSIPIIILIDEEGNEYTRWGPRAASVQLLVDDYKKELPEKDDPNFETIFKETIKKINALYTSDTSLWKIIEDDMLATFLK